MGRSGDRLDENSPENRSMTLKLARCLEMNLHHAGALPHVALETMLLEKFAADARRAWLDYQAIHIKTADNLLCR